MYNFELESNKDIYCLRSFKLPNLNCKVMFIQINKHKTAQYFLQIFQCSTMLIYTFCKICERKCKHEIVFVTKIKTKQFQVRTCIRNLTKNLNNLTNCILLWKNWRKYGSVSYSFSCIISQLFCIIIFKSKIFVMVAAWGLVIQYVHGSN